VEGDWGDGDGGQVGIFSMGNSCEEWKGVLYLYIYIDDMYICIYIFVYVYITSCMRA